MPAKTILITGANRGIGFGIVESILRISAEHTVIIGARNYTDAQAAIEQLQDKGHSETSLHPLTLDVTDDKSIEAAVAEVQRRFGRLDVLINNAGIARLEKELSTYRTDWAAMLDTNVISVRIVSSAFVPLLDKSADPRVINISSARGSFDRLLSGRDPGIVTIPYACSKACLNFLTLQLGREHKGISFYAVSPGHCKTALNGYRGAKDPVEGGKAAAELTLADQGGYKAGFWEDEGDGLVEVGW